MNEDRRNWQILVLSTYFSLGAFALISQTMMLREFFVVVYGNELVFGVLLANWLVGIFTGALTGGAAVYPGDVCSSPCFHHPRPPSLYHQWNVSRYVY
jgi:hypothetical protein